MNGKERILNMLAGRSVDRLPLMPITMMFATDQLGQPYGKYATDYEVLVEGQLLTAERFGFDYVSVISDPAREAADCGARIRYFDDQPPAIDEDNALLADKATLATLAHPHPLSGGRMHDRVKAAELFKRRVGDQLLIEGWVEGPCAESADLRGINTLMMDFFDDPEFVRDMFEYVVENGIRFAQAQVDAGVDLIGIGDAAASLVGPQIYEEFVFPYEQRLVTAIQAMGAKVRLHICGNISQILEPIGRLKCELVDVDSMVPLANCRQAMGDQQVLAGNLNPVDVLRNGTPDSIHQALEQCFREAGPNYIVAAGCEVPRDTPDENVHALREFAEAAL